LSKKEKSQLVVWVKLGTGLVARQGKLQRSADQSSWSICGQNGMKKEQNNGLVPRFANNV